MSMSAIIFNQSFCKRKHYSSRTLREELQEDGEGSIDYKLEIQIHVKMNFCLFVHKI